MKYNGEGQEEWRGGREKGACSLQGTKRGGLYGRERNRSTGTEREIEKERERKREKGGERRGGGSIISLLYLG